jgi:hypothetical protein
VRIGSQSPSSTKPDPCDGDRAKAEVSQKKKRRQAPREEFVAYVVAIECWDWSFTLLGNDDKRPVDPYHEFRHLQITGRLLRPIGLKTDRVELALLPTNDMSEAKRKGYDRAGSLDALPGIIRGSIGIPADVLSPILQMLIAKELNFILMTGSEFRHRSARLTGLRLEMKLDEDDLPAPDALA